MKKRSCVILACTGTVGQRLVDMLANHPYFDIIDIAASKRSAGLLYRERLKDQWYLPSEIPEEIGEMRIKLTNPKEVEKADIAFSALPSDEAKTLEIEFAKAGFFIESKASANRMRENVPLLIPELNANHLDILKEQTEWSGSIVTDPNCTTVGFAMVVKPILEAYGIKSVIANTWQAISGSGIPGVPGLLINENVIPYIGGEEEKVESEVLKIAGKIENGKIIKEKFPIAATCTRVPVTDGHFETAYINTVKKVEDIEDIVNLLRNFKGIKEFTEIKSKLTYAPNDPIIVRNEINRPQPRLDRDAGTVPGMAVTVGRIRRGIDDYSINLCVLSHNTIRGAAGSSVLGAEVAIAKNLV
ncbi:MAG: aspartate-semialdehyde dehydrogenase [Candidatus Lokiarchaeota archaeon]|nr:aspartate-semialdehyde dehydrogenase [Candidatus Lokiarchaeota archaeon]